ncbi:hypothetical protein ACQR1Q_33480, partial [Bradyrhizobium oligotrophicum]|uniref:hypothetical protein n=1 Tax=Bradyrhizobium oligotrophicum TaxID=44255 RepID=UPI003EC1359E
MSKIHLPKSRLGLAGKFPAKRRVGVKLVHLPWTFEFRLYQGFGFVFSSFDIARTPGSPLRP